jgi:hypothetical protein
MIVLKRTHYILSSFSGMLTEEESLFGYYNSNTSGRNFTFFNDPAKAKPVTFIADATNYTEILITACTHSTGLNLTHCKGNKACIVDTIGSCQKDFGEMSLDTEKNAIKDKELIGTTVFCINCLSY